MKMESKKYNGKVILFGEYSMIFGADALLVPYRDASAEWDFCSKNPDYKTISSNRSLNKFLSYLKENDFDDVLKLSSFEEDIKSGLYLKSDIPSGYGLGSSGALVAAVYDHYGKKKDLNPLVLKSIFAKMENCFHSSSSGNDPLQCYFGQPFVISKDGFKLLYNDFLIPEINVFLIDSGIKSKTGPLVSYFKECRNDAKYMNIFENEYVPCVKRCIDTMIFGVTDAFFTVADELSDLQMRLFKPMIPESIMPLFAAARNDRRFCIKISGSGGGGFFIAFTKDESIDIQNKFPVIKLLN